jgi:hypothetical protein
MMKRWMMPVAGLALMALVAACGQENQTVTVPAQAPLMVTLDQPVTTKYHQIGDMVEATVSEAVYVDDVLAIPTGSTLRGRVTGSERSDGPEHPARLTIAFEELAGPNGEVQRLATQPLQLEGVPPITDMAEGMSEEDMTADAMDDPAADSEVADLDDPTLDETPSAAEPMLDDVGAIVSVIETRPYPTLVPATADNEIGLAPGQTLRLALAEPAQVKAVPLEIGHAEGS